MMDSYQLLRPLLFQLETEQAHNLTLALASHFPLLGSWWQRPLSPRLSCSVGNTTWRTPIGLAAGLDKNAAALEFFARLGFGAMECGTLTPAPQVGNPLPRMWRYPTELSLRNAMGFPNEGMQAAIPRLAARPKDFPVAVNIGKSKAATATQALDEYAQLYDGLAPLCDWVVVNISSPNTPGLRDLQQEDWLRDLFKTLAPLKARHGKEIFVKLAPDMEDEVLKGLTSALADFGADGLVATNTTHMPERGAGGVSGRLLRVKAHQKRRVVLDVVRDRKLPLVGVGGFEDMKDVFAWWAAGGDAFQVYTSFIYRGPAMLKELEHGMLSFLDRAGVADVKTFLALAPRERQKLIGSFGA